MLAAGSKTVTNESQIIVKDIIDESLARLEPQVKEVRVNQGEEYSNKQVYSQSTCQTQTENNIFCTVCENIFDDQKDLVEHLSIRHSVEAYNCQLCKAVCKNQTDLVIHYATSHEVITFECNQCSQGFKNKVRKEA